MTLLLPVWPALLFGASPSPAPGDPASDAPPENASLRSAREQFAAQVKAGVLVNFAEKDGQVIFRSSAPNDDSHRPGPLEDEMIAGAIRGRIAAVPQLAALKLTVEAQGGEIRLRGNTENAVLTASAINLALEVDGVREVRADLPPALRGAATPTQNSAVRGPGFPAP